MFLFHLLKTVQLLSLCVDLTSKYMADYYSHKLMPQYHNTFFVSKEIKKI